MGRSDDVEFLAADGDALPNRADVLAVEPKRVSRRTVIGGLLAVIAVAAVGAALQGGRKPGAPRPPAAAPAVATPTTIPHNIGRRPADAVGLPVDEPAVDIAVAGRRLYVLQATRLSMIDTRTLRTDLSVELGGPDAVGWERIVLDAASRRIWLVTVGPGPGLILELDALTLERRRTASWSPPISSTAAMDGRLFFTSPLGLAVLDPHAELPRLIVATDNAGQVVADPTRGRLLLLRIAQHSEVRAVSPAGRTLAQARLGFGKGDIAVTYRTIWVAGFGDSGAELHQLDPSTLKAGPNLGLADQLSPGAVVAAAGRASLWLRSGSSVSEVLYCTNVTGAVIASWWTLPGRITSDAGEAFVADAGVVRVVTLFSGCSG